MEHYPTETPGNFAEQAHIYAFNEGGPRGEDSGRPEDINRLANLMLLCGNCHHLVDAECPEEYPVEVLKRFKKDHEDRIRDLTDLSKDRDTVPLVLRGRVMGRPMDISDEVMQSAVAPSYLKRREKVEIDLTAIPDSPDTAFWKTTCETIDQRIAQLYAIKPRRGRTLRVSVFALAPIPSLVYLGSRLSDKMDVDLYQRHRDPETWSWKEGPGEAKFLTRSLATGQEACPVVLLVNLSGANGLEAIPRAIASGASVYELTLDGQDPTPLFLNTVGDLERFTATYIRALAMIRQAHPRAEALHLLPAVPAPVAVTLGRARLSKVDPKLRVYDRDARAEGFVFALEVP